MGNSFRLTQNMVRCVAVMLFVFLEQQSAMHCNFSRASGVACFADHSLHSELPSDYG
jgi:hypothetical protein